jgi:hypothetical protein
MIETRISGIPCQVEMTSGRYIHGSHSRDAPSDIDYHGGWVDLEFEVYDRRGRPANWLKAKLNDADLERITQELIAAAER